jgi:hypothetical protein
MVDAVLLFRSGIGLDLPSVWRLAPPNCWIQARRFNGGLCHFKRLGLGVAASLRRRFCSARFGATGFWSDVGAGFAASAVASAASSFSLKNLRSVLRLLTHERPTLVAGSRFASSK